ncbi:hypothetical protein TgHK011_000371 [Trichoderma gracile]|nr:hypothetical protein TgHK011_000371 [Trichoderma gracile]
MAQTGNLGCTVMAKPQNVEKKKFTGLLGCTVMAKPAANDKKFTGNLGCTVIPGPASFAAAPSSHTHQAPLLFKSPTLSIPRIGHCYPATGLNQYFLVNY